MPELPEVETVKRILEPQLVGKRITLVKILNEQVIAHPEPTQFSKELQNQTIKNLSRRGKYLTINFENESRLSLHLRMTGQLLVMPKDEPIEKHTHLILSLSNDEEIRYIDVRRFGRFWYFKKGEVDTVSGQSKLGLEPDDPNLTKEYLKEKLQNKRKKVKEALHDQTIIAGIGNIYSDEILFASKIFPNTKCSELLDADFEILAEKIPEVISWGTEKNKMTPKEYLKGKGKDYRNTPFLFVYGREGEPCKICGEPLKRVVISGRSSCYCPSCQRNGEYDG